MTSRHTQTQLTLFSLALILVGQAAVSAEPSQSLAEKRLGIIRGTTPGIVIIDFDKKPLTAASAPTVSTAASTSASAGTATGAAVTTPTTTPATSANNAQPAADAPADKPIVNRLFSALPPPTGRSLQSARRLDAPDQGIALPTARAASQPQEEPATKH